MLLALLSDCVALMSDQYEKINPGLLPEVIEAAVRSTVLGKQTGDGLLITTVGRGFIVTETGWIVEHVVPGSTPFK